MDTPPPSPLSAPPPLPSDIAPPLRPAGFLIRVVASIIDMIFMLILTGPLLFAVYGREYLISVELVKGPADFLISYVLPAVVTIVFWVIWRGTPGKLLCGLRVVDARERDSIDLLQAVLRYFGYLLSALPLFLGFLWIAFDPRKHGFHDKVAGTLVIRK